MQVQHVLFRALALLVLSSASAAAAATTTAGPPAPAPATHASIRGALADPAVRASFTRPIVQLTALAWMSGTWKVRVIRHIGPHRETSHAATYVFATTLNGRWMFGGGRDARDGVYITYDPLGKHWTLVRLDTTPSYGIFVSGGGWHSGRILFASVAAFADGRPHQRTTTILKRTERSFVIYDKEQLAAGTDVLDDIISLTKQ